jgi:hypothetical protein
MRIGRGVQMTITNKLASSLGRKDEEPNIELARTIVAEDDEEVVQELVNHLNRSSSKKDIQSDCIKVLYEVGALKPSLISAHYRTFLELLNHKNNRLVWGAMTALDAITLEIPNLIYSELSVIIEAVNSGSVIVKDHGVGVLIKLCSLERYAEKAFPLLVEILKSCPTNQLPMYAENALPIVKTSNKLVFTEALLDRLIEIEKDSKRKRVEKVIHKLQKI